MNILMAFHHFPVSTGRYVADGLRRQGHDVRTIGKPRGVDTGWGDRRCDARYVHQPAGDYDMHWRDWRPDFILVTDPYTDKAWRHKHYSNVPHYCYNTCNNVTNLVHPSYDHYFVAHYHAKAMPYVEGGSYTWMPNAYDPVWHTPSKIPFEHRAYDVAFVGSLHTDRRGVMDACKFAGLSVEVAHGPIYQEYTEIYNNARFAVVTSTHGHSGASYRFFENAMQGCIVLSGPCEDRALFEPQPQGYLWFETPQHAAQLAMYYKQNSEEAKKLIRQSQAWAAPHTWDARGQMIVNWHKRQTQ
jgi:hypothetical protein